MSDLTALGIGALLLLGNAFFVGAEFALISARRTQIEPRAEEGSRAARITLRAMEKVSLMMAGAQLGITMCSLGLGAIAEPALAHLIEPLFVRANVPQALVHPVAFTIALSIVVTLHMVLGEMVPKNIAIAGPERSALILGPPMYAVVKVLRPLILLLNATANVVLRAIRVQPQDEVLSTFTPDEVAGFITESRREGLLTEIKHELLTGALVFTEEDVHSVLLPVGDLVTVEQDVSVADLEDLCARTGFSRFPVVDSVGNLAGYIHLKDTLDTPHDQRDEPVQPAFIRPLVTLRSDAPLREALATMQAQGAHLARVVDPAGSSVLGVAALEDVLEELVGEVVDAGQEAG